MKKYGLDPARYDKFAYLCYLDVDDLYVQNYVAFQLGKEAPCIVGRIKAHQKFWESLSTPSWLLDVICSGVKIPFESRPPRIVLPNNKSAVTPDVVKWVRSTILEYEKFGFIQRVSEVPYCISPLQVKDTGGKMALI